MAPQPGRSSRWRPTAYPRRHGRDSDWISMSAPVRSRSMKCGGHSHPWRSLPSYWMTQGCSCRSSSGTASGIRAFRPMSMCTSRRSGRKRAFGSRCTIGLVLRRLLPSPDRYVPALERSPAGGCSSSIDLRAVGEPMGPGIGLSSMAIGRFAPRIWGPPPRRSRPGCHPSCGRS